MGNWCPFALNDIYNIPARPDLACYGPGSNNWGVQTNQKAFAAFATLACDPAFDAQICKLPREQILETALRLLRFSLESHIEGSYKCLDNSKWGHTWISVLGIERMMHAVEAILPILSEEDIALLGKVMLSEADWLTDHYEVVGDPDGCSGKNRPESNLWNGAFLHRVAMMYPDAVRIDAYREKGTAFLINSISLPSDACSDNLVDGRPLRERFVGANFFESLSLDHHGYLNVGYMGICLSNVAILHFSFKQAGIRPPEALYHHVRDLWELVKQFTFPDGRLLRIGGDTRVRYCYCQDYMIPSWLLAADWLHDSDALVFEREWFAKLETEISWNADSSFLSDRCRILRDKSPLYYTRLEADRACTISMGACWRRIFQIPVSDPETPVLNGKAFSWSEPFHGALFHKDSSRIASWVWRAAESPSGIFVPAGCSDMAEWRHNLAGESCGLGRKNWNELKSHTEEAFTGGFVSCGSFVSRSGELIAEGETDENLVLHHVAFAALPDSRSGIVLQRAQTLRRCQLKSVKGLNLLVPNDLFNGARRELKFQNGESRNFVWNAGGKDFVWDSGSRSMLIDGKLGVQVIYGADSLLVHTPAERQIGMKMKPEAGGMLNAIEICSSYAEGKLDFDEGEFLFDSGCALFASSSLPELVGLKCCPVSCSESSEFRAVMLEGADARHYLFVANFGGKEGGVRLLLPSPLGSLHCLNGVSFQRDGEFEISLRLPSCATALFV